MLAEPNRPQAGSYSINRKKSAREIFAGAHSFCSKTTISLRPGRSGRGRFFVFDHSRSLRLGQYDFPNYNPIAHC